MKEYRWVWNFIVSIGFIILNLTPWFINPDITDNFVFIFVEVLIICLLIDGFGYSFKCLKDKKIKILGCILLIVLVGILNAISTFLYCERFFDLNYNAYNQVITDIEKKNFPENKRSIYSLPKKYKYLSKNQEIEVIKKNQGMIVVFPMKYERETIVYSSYDKLMFTDSFVLNKYKVIRKRHKWFILWNLKLFPWLKTDKFQENK